MTDLLRVLAIAVPGIPALAALLCLVPGAAAGIDRILVSIGVVGGLSGAACGAWILARGGDALGGGWYVIDAPAGLFTLVIAGVAGGSAALSPAYLARATRSGTGAAAARRYYATALLAFWAVLATVPFAGNLGLGWLLLEATTAASALLVAFSGGRSALEAGWKYLILTSCGLAVALLGIVLLVVSGVTSGAGIGSLDFASLRDAVPGQGGDLAAAAAVLIIVGMAAKAGWAPVHNWLPDAHSEAPPPVSPILSAALLPTVALQVWRTVEALSPAVGEDLFRHLLGGIGLASLAVAVPFLWRPMAWKRFLAYSSLEHMGVIAIGIAMQNRYAAAGVFIHVAGHAAAKALGFWAATPLLRYQPSAGRRPPRGLLRLDGTLATSVIVSAGALSGLPPSPRFASELLVIAGAVDAGAVAFAAVTAVLLALGFIGIIHVLIESVPGRISGRRPTGRRAMRPLQAACALSLVALGLVGALAFTLPDAALTATLLGGG